MIGLLSSVFVASVVGSLHCVGMCGPFVTLASTAPDRVRLPQVRTSMWGVASYNVGRLAGYLVLGTIAGAVGRALDLGAATVGLQRTAAVLAGALLIVAGGWSLLRHVSGARGPRTSVSGAGSGLGLGRGLSRLSRGVMGLSPRARGFALGGLSAALPCGWLYAFVLTAAGVADPWMGLAVMFAFWLGTVPALGLLAVSLRKLGLRLGKRLRWIMPALMIAVGIYTLTYRAPLNLEGLHESAQTERAVPNRGDVPCH